MVRCHTQSKKHLPSATTL